MNTLARDLRYAWRMLLRKPGFTALTVVTLALGIGLNTAVFSAIDALLLRPLPGTRAPNELVQLYRRWPGLDFGSNSVPHWRDVRERAKDVFTDAAVWNFEFTNLSADGKTQQVMSQMVSANFFSVLGVTPQTAFLPPRGGPGGGGAPGRRREPRGVDERLRR